MSDTSGWQRNRRLRIKPDPLRDSLGGARITKFGSIPRRRLTVVPIRQRTGFLGSHWRRHVQALRQGRYYVTDQAVAGDAPKDFIRVYEFGLGRRIKPETWPAFIAKVGHKWYPAESATEQLMTRIGECLGIRVADSRLMHADNQIRFLSRYFLHKDEILVHGAEIVAGYLEDEEFVHDVENEQAESEIFTFPVLRTAIETRFPGEKIGILRDLVRMIAFDALVGNQDRHLYNWGVITHARGSRRPVFSPVYDTARGLFWNSSDAGLSRFENAAGLEKYVMAAHPLIGWEDDPKLNHFKLVENIALSDLALHSELCSIDTAGALARIGMVIDTEFRELLSRRRRTLIKKTLEVRFQKFDQVLK